MQHAAHRPPKPAGSPRKMRRFKTRIVAILFAFCLLSVSTLFYLMLIFDEKKLAIEPPPNVSKPLLLVGFSEVRPENLTLKGSYEKRIKMKLNTLPESTTDSPSVKLLVESFVAGLKEDLAVLADHHDVKSLWLIARRWVRARQIIPERAPELGSVLDALQRAKIIKADVSRKGTQLKLLLTLEGDQYALFKPQRYPRDYIADGIYAGADRHNGEIVAFHLSRILNLRYAPIVASRKVRVADEIKAVASDALAATFVTKNGTKECFYGQCYFCSEYDLLCPDDHGELEGAMVLMLPRQYQLQRLRHPWLRTYRQSVKASWEMDSHYCASVLKTHPLRPRVLDLVDGAVFDYLIGNADRHHYEVFKEVSNSALLLIDNGKSFGDPHHDELTILFPLLQCCVIRNSTYQHLKRLSASGPNRLSATLIDLLQTDRLWPLLTSDHLRALDRRLRTVIASIETCFDSFSKNHVLNN